MENNNRKTFFMFLLAFLVAFFIVSFVEVLRSSLLPSGAPEIQSASAISPFDGTAPASFADLAERVKPAVVNISTTKIIKGKRFINPFGRSPFDDYFGDDFFNRFFGDIPQRDFKQKSLGSGFIISNDGYILTNNHVVENTDKILVKISDGKEYEAKIVGQDEKTDIALIKIKPNHDLPVAEIGDSDSLRVGEWVIAIGNPFGLSQTVTAGIVSAKGRVIGAGPYDNFIQTDASINPGNSGGPLFNMQGKVVGINTAIVAQGQGIGFAIPINMAKSILGDLKTKGKVSRGWLGISIQDITEDIAKSMGYKGTTGVLVTDVFQGDPADKAGIKVGDVILEINDKKISDSHDLLLTVASLHAGERAKIKISRDGKEMIFNVTIAERKSEPEIALAKSEGNFGIKAQEITKNLAKQLGISSDYGVIVTDVEPGSPADEVGIQPRDIILQVNKVKITSFKQYLTEMSKAVKNKNVVLLVKRGKSNFFVSIREE
jgi:serine protease Do